MQKSPILDVWWALATPQFYIRLKDISLANFAKVRQLESDYWMISYYANRHLKKSCKPRIIWTPSANMKCFAVLVSPLLTPCTRSAEYDCINLPMFSLLLGLCLSVLRSSVINRVTNLGSSVENWSIIGGPDICGNCSQ